MCERGRGGGVRKRFSFPSSREIFYLFHIYISSLSLSLRFAIFFEESHFVIENKKKLFLCLGFETQKNIYISKMCGGAGMCVRGRRGGDKKKILFSLLHGNSSFPIYTFLSREREGYQIFDFFLSEPLCF